jgi:hypothetical protein
MLLVNDGGYGGGDFNRGQDVVIVEQNNNFRQQQEVVVVKNNNFAGPDVVFVE